MIYFSTIPVTQKPQRLQIAYIHGTSQRPPPPEWTSAIIKIISAVMHCRCVFKDETESEHLSKSLTQENKNKTTTSWGNKPVYTHTHQTHTPFSASVVDTLWVNGGVSVSCVVELLELIPDSKKSSLLPRQQVMFLVLQLVCMVVIKYGPAGSPGLVRGRSHGLVREPLARLGSAGRRSFLLVSSYFKTRNDSKL